MKAITLLLAALAVVVPAVGTGAEESKHPLCGGTGYECFQLFNECQPIRLIFRELHPSAAELGITLETLHNAVAPRLRRARLYATADKPVGSLLITIGIAGAAFSINIEKLKKTRDDYADSWYAGTTWSMQGTGIHSNETGFIIQSLHENVDEFIAAYLRVNEPACTR